MNRHTPGPWHQGAGNGEGSIFGPEGSGRYINGALWPICTMTGGPDTAAQDTANAALIAAAPALLAALQNIDSNAAESAKWIRRVARNAIALAEGEQ